MENFEIKRADLFVAIKNGEFDKVAGIIDKRKDLINSREFDRYGDTPLCQAIIWDQYDIAKLLLENGADANLCGTIFPPILQVAAYLNDERALIYLKLLVERNVDIDVVKDGRNVLMYAIYYNRFECVKYCVEELGLDPMVMVKYQFESLEYVGNCLDLLKNMKNVDAGKKSVDMYLKIEEYLNKKIDVDEVNEVFSIIGTFKVLTRQSSSLDMSNV